ASPTWSGWAASSPPASPISRPTQRSNRFGAPAFRCPASARSSTWRPTPSSPTGSARAWGRGRGGGVARPRPPAGDARALSFPPRLGEHNEKIYGEALGLSAERLAELRQRQIV